MSNEEDNMIRRNSDDVIKILDENGKIMWLDDEIGAGAVEYTLVSPDISEQIKYFKELGYSEFMIGFLTSISVSQRLFKETIEDWIKKHHLDSEVSQLKN